MTASGRVYTIMFGSNCTLVLLNFHGIGFGVLTAAYLFKDRQLELYVSHENLTF